MPLQVLQPVHRRSRRRRRLLPFVLLLALLAGAAAAVWWFSVRDRGHEPAAAQRLAGAPARIPVRPTKPRRGARPVGPLLVAPRPAHVATPRLAPHARAAIVVDGDTGRVLWMRRPHARLHVASTTKIMTALLALERLRPTRTVTIARAATRVPLIKEGLRPGERVAAWKLFYGLMLYSGNDDALALAIASAGSRPAFVRLMNAEAHRLGMTDTHFSSPSGVVDRDNYSSAWDMAALTRYAFRNARFRTIVRTRVKRVPWRAPTFEKIYVNKNHLLKAYRGADGVKTGWTTLASHCLVASATRNGLHLVAVVLHSSDPVMDARSLLDYGFRIRG